MPTATVAHPMPAHGFFDGPTRNDPAHVANTGVQALKTGFDVTKYLAVVVPQMAAYGVTITALNPILLPISAALAIIDAIMNWRDLDRTNRIVIDLEDALKNNSTSDAEVKEAVTWAIQKQNMRVRRSATGTIFFIGSVVNTFEKFGKWASKKAKGTLHKNREKYAPLLADKAIGGNKLAIAAVKTLVSEKVWEEFNTAKTRDGLCVLVYRSLEAWRGAH
jgi:hypothetical protein